MKLKRIECEQFAGIKDKEIKFTDGLNILVGENESGKSTMVDLIFHTLFKDSKIDKRSDSEFIDHYFPKKAEGKSGDVIDGSLRFETATGDFKIEKEWEIGDGSSKLTTPDGDKIKSESEIRKILMAELGYGEGVYNELVFPSQKRRKNLLEAILKETSTKKKKEDADITKEELAGTITQAALETGGVSIDKMEKEIDAKLNLYGENWDFASDGPRGGASRGIENKWNSATTKDADAGKQSVILRAYYDVKDMERAQEKARIAEEQVDIIKSEIREFLADKDELDKSRQDFQKYRSILGQTTQIMKTLSVLKNQQNERTAAMTEWPGLQIAIEKAKELKAQKTYATARDLYNEVRDVQKSYEESKTKLEKIPKVDPDDAIRVSSLQRLIESSESKMSGLDILAKINQLGDIPVEIRSISTGEKLDISDDTVQIKEAVIVSVAGVMEMQLMPQGLDVEKIQDEIKENREKIKVIFDKYGVSSVDEIKSLEKEHDEISADIKVIKATLDGKLKDTAWEDIEKAYASVPADLSSTSDINDAINEHCNGNADTFISAKEATQSGYKDKYDSIEELQKLIDDNEAEINKTRESLSGLAEVPEEYKSIEDPEEYDKELGEQIKEAEDNLEKLRDDLREAERNLGEQSAEDYSEELDRLKIEFEEKKTVYAHWAHIKDVFVELKESAKGNPMQDIEENFRKYLALITGEKISLSSISEGMSAVITSGKNALTYPILSDGTKDTISLAFRLAMLEHLFPEGEGLAIFDDPFTDMDPERVKQACALIQEYAKKNQVIFITCDDKYKELLDGKEIELD